MEPGPIETIVARLKQYFPVLVNLEVCCACFAFFIFTSQRDRTKHKKISLQSTARCHPSPNLSVCTTGANPRFRVIVSVLLASRLLQKGQQSGCVITLLFFCVYIYVCARIGISLAECFSKIRPAAINTISSYSGQMLVVEITMDMNLYTCSIGQN